MRKKIYFISYLLMMVFTQEVYAYKFVLFTDEKSAEKAQEITKLFSKTYPFNTFKIEFLIVKKNISWVDCATNNKINGVEIKRSIGCANLEEIQKEAIQKGGDQAMVVKDLPDYAGTMHPGAKALGGGVPIMTTKASARVMLHEFLHSLGLCDEYKYEAREAEIYCKNKTASPNAVPIKLLGSYGSDGEARSKHGKEIPWYKDILQTTLITQVPKLGTGNVDFETGSSINTSPSPWSMGEPTGLYRGKTCDEYVGNNGVVIFHPGGTSSIMDKAENGLGAPLEKIVERLLIARGFQKKMGVTPTVSAEIKLIQSETSSAAPAPSINDTGRDHSKSFSDWMESVFDSVGKASGR